MAAWLVGDGGAHFEVIRSSLSSSDGPIELGDEEAALKLESFFDDDTSQERLSIVTTEASTTFLQKLTEQLDLGWISMGDRLTVIILSQTADWASALSPTFQDLFSAFGYRKALIRHFDVYSLENTLLDYAQRGMLRLHIVLAGELYGEHCFGFANTLKCIYSAELQLTAAHEQLNSIVPLIHVRRFQALLSELLSGTGKWPTVLPGFDFDGSGVLDTLSAYDSSVNPSPPLATSEQPPEHSDSQDIPESTPTDELFQLLTRLSACNIVHLQHLFATPPSSSSAGPAAFTMRAMFNEVWGEFLTFNGLQPVYVFVAGPPKSGKTEHARALADSLKVACIDLIGAVTFALQLSEARIAFDAEQLRLDAAAIVAFQKELSTAVEAKLGEGKKGKDKSAADGKIDLAAVTEAVCLGLPGDVRRKAIGLAFALNSVCKRRGCVWDIWEKGCLEELTELGAVVHLFAAVATSNDEAPDNETRPTSDGSPRSTGECVPIHAVLELQCDDKTILGKYNDYLTAQQMKPKDAQAAVKAFEGTLPAYFGQLLSVEGAEPLLTHPKVSAFVGARSDVAVLRPALSSALGAVVAPEDVTARVRDALEGLLGRSIGWLVPVSRPMSSGSGSRPVTAGIQDALSASASVAETDRQADEANGTGEAAEPTGLPEMDPAVKEKVLANTEKVSSFLANTILPVVTRAVVEVMRDRPEDPIMYVANFLARQSELNQSEAHDSARQRFYELLEKGTW